VLCHARKYLLLPFGIHRPPGHPASYVGAITVILH
jgi:hypothetical protein